MFEFSVEDRPEADVAPAHAPGERRCAPCEERAARVRPEDVARFVRDPMAYATWAGASTPEAFVKTYLEGLERRLSGIVGAPRADGLRLATLAAQSMPVGDGADTAAPAREGGGELDRAPRMGPVIVACAVVQAAASVVAAGAAVYTALSKRSPN
jgi:hypothetical protein